MSKLFLIGDLHFGESHIIRYEGRPFDNSDEMDEEYVRLWNETASDKDTVIVVGDFGADGYENDILSALNGRKILVKGNHDTKSNEEYRRLGFDEVYDFPILYDGFFLISHDPIYISERMPYVNIFAHVHGSPAVKDHSGYHYCVSAERSGGKPVLFDDIKRIIGEHRKEG